MNKNTDLHTKITPEQMEQALRIINQAWVDMNGDEFAKLCLDSDPSDAGSKNWINENFTRFRNDLGGQINKTSGEYMPKLAAGLVEFYNQHRTPQPYYVLVVDYGNGWEWEFGAYDRSDVIVERDYAVRNACNNGEQIKTKVIKTVSNATVSDLMNELNGNAKPAASDQLAGPVKSPTEEKPKSKSVKNEKNIGFGNRDAFRKAAVKVIESAALTRKKSGALISEADLVSGAITIMQLVDVECFGADPDHLQIMPPNWLFGIMRGESINGGSLPANTVLIETWTEYGEKCASFTYPQHIEVIQKNIDEIKEEFNGEDLAMELASIQDLKKSIRG